MARLFKSLFKVFGKYGRKNDDVSVEPTEKTWFQLDVTPLDSIYKLIS